MLHGQKYIKLGNVRTA